MHARDEQRQMGPAHSRRTEALVVAETTRLLHGEKEGADREVWGKKD
jgi:hypothetical protein